MLLLDHVKAITFSQDHTPYQMPSFDSKALSTSLAEVVRFPVAYPACHVEAGRYDAKGGIDCEQVRDFADSSCDQSLLLLADKDSNLDPMST